ncbi:hypothetical protein LCGC14_2819670 [marine sediment metagenome]|uniref:AAA domain-containing protein n=1 Tax=marine sediment metagenome TaxID=412755 RepID=A0A0F8Z469_9ZZZZ
MNPKIVSLISAAGGVGKTTIAVLLGWFLKERNKKTLLIDMDPSLGLTLNLFDFADYKRDLEDHNKTSADFLESTLKTDKLRKFDFNHVISTAFFQKYKLDLIASSIRLETVMGSIWYNPTSGHREKKLKEALGYIPPKFNYDYIIIDSIPCYAIVYAMTTLYASDVCIIPLRLTRNDLGRTISMIKKLQEDMENVEVNEDDFYNKLLFVFNRVNTQYSYDDKVPRYIDEIRKAMPKAQFFDKFIGQQAGFPRIGTSEEKSDDAKKVKKAFEPFFEDFMEKIG